MNAPQLRFKGFNDAWKHCTFGDIGTIAMNKRIFKNQTSEHGDIPFYKIGTFGKKADAFISKDLFEKYKKLYPYPRVGNILISASGTIGRTIVYNGEQAYYQDSNIVWLDTNPNEIDDKFLNYIYQVVKWNGIEGTTIKRLYNKNILNTKINIPNIQEQQKIGTFFSKLDDLITKQTQKVALLKQLKRGYLQKLFPQAGQITSQLRFKGFNGIWKSKQIKDIYLITRGKVLSKSEISSTGTYPVYSSQTINNGLLGYYDKFLFRNAITWTTDGANAGTVNYRQGKFYCTNVCGVLLSDEGYVNNCMAEIINSVAFKYVSKVGNPKLMNNVMANIIINVPCLLEQQKISSLFAKLDHLIELQNRKLALLQELKKGYLQKIFI